VRRRVQQRKEAAGYRRTTASALPSLYFESQPLQRLEPFSARRVGRLEPLAARAPRTEGTRNKAGKLNPPKLMNKQQYEKLRDTLALSDAARAFALVVFTNVKLSVDCQLN
jgi:hypothetical protein